MVRKWLIVLFVAVAAAFTWYAVGCGPVNNPPNNFLPRIGF